MTIDPGKKKAANGPAFHQLQTCWWGAIWPRVIDARGGEVAGRLSTSQAPAPVPIDSVPQRRCLLQPRWLFEATAENEASRAKSKAD